MTSGGGSDLDLQPLPQGGQGRLQPIEPGVVDDTADRR